MGELIPGLRPADAAALSTAAHARMRTIEKASQAQALSMEAVRGALNTREFAENAAQYAAKARALRAQAQAVTRDSQDRFLGLIPAVEQTTREHVEEVLREEAPVPPLYL